MFNKKMKWSSGLIFLLLTTFLMVISPMALAANGDGTGNGGNGGIMKPLGLTSVTLADGTKVNDAVNIPLKPKFTFLFDKNVVYLLYWERNVNCFHLYDENNKELALNITKIDDTVDFSKRQDIWVEPVAALSPGTNYWIVVAPDLMAKNGGSTLAMTTNNQGATIKFETAGETTANNSGTAAPPGNSTAATTASQDQPTATNSTNSTNQTSPSNNDSSTTESASSSKAGTEATTQAASQTTPQPAPGTNTNQTSCTSVSSGTDSKQPTNPEAGTSQNDQAKTVPAVPKQADPAQAAKPVESVQRKVANYVAGIGVALIAVWLIIEFIRRKRKKK